MRWQLNSLRSRIVLLTAVLFALVQALAYFFVSSAHQDNARVAVAHQLGVGGRLLERLVEDRARQLQREAESLVEHSMALQRLNNEASGLEQAIAKASLSQGLDLSMLLGVDGRVMKDFSGAFASGSDFPLPGLLSEAARLGRGYAVARLASKAFVVAAVPVGEGAGQVAGLSRVRARWFLAGLRIDHVMASDLKQLSGLDVSIVETRRGRDAQVLATTLPDKLRGALVKQLGVGASAWGQSKVLNLQGKSFETRQFALTTDGTVVVAAVLQRSLEDVLAASRRLRWLLLVLACISIPASVWASVWIARSITRPLHALTKAAVRIQQGQYDQIIEVESADELAVLADSLNHMRTGIASREAEIMRLAYEDPLTGLPNRARLMQRLRAILDGQAGGVRHGMVLYLNLDRFQVINDTLGHAAGDAVLREVAHRLEQVVAHVVGGVLAATGTEGFIARAEGDEFVVVLPGATSAIAAETVREIASALRPAIEVSGQPVDAGASIGVSAYPADATEAGALIQKASIAMVQAKRNNQLYAYYEPGADVARREQLSLLGELRNAVQHSELRACYQPKIDLKTQQVSGVEALVRWRHPKRGLTLPALFMPYAEKTGFVRVITRWML
ncbi:MAG TPA: diguanylate cyclase, partial [Burkholderiaceae bacterium]|nr:diguanylate cyclase [Burkholderiaceae bacterium]